MPDNTQDAGESTHERPAPVSLNGEKIIGADGLPLGVWADACLIDADGAGETAIGSAIARAGAGTVVACWSGSPDASAEDPFPDDPSRWTPAAWSALDATIDRLLPILADRDATLVLRTHHRHVVGDVPSVLKFARSLGERGIGRVGVLLDVESMLAESMLARNPEDHRRRIREAVFAVAGAARFEIV